MAQNVKDWQNLDVYPTSNVNVSPYFADGFVFPAVPYLMTPRCRKFTYEQRDIHDNSGFTIRDVEIFKSLVDDVHGAELCRDGSDLTRKNMDQGHGRSENSTRIAL